MSDSAGKLKEWFKIPETMGIKGAGASMEMPTYLQFIQSFY